MNDENPYNSPTTASAKADAIPDFRSRAVAASGVMQRNLPRGQSPERGGISCCLARQPSLSRFRGPIKITAVVSLVLGLSGLAAGPIILHLQKGSGVTNDPALLAIAFSCSVGGILLMLVPTFVENWIVRRHLSQSGEHSDSEREGIHIALEQASTYGTMKILAEDVGLIYLHPEAGYVKISGLSYDYVIQSRDVVSLSLHRNGKTVLLSYKVKDEQLDLAIIPRNLLAELKRQTLGSSRTLFVKIQDVLKTQR